MQFEPGAFPVFLNAVVLSACERNQLQQLVAGIADGVARKLCFKRDPPHLTNKRGFRGGS
jgi:hypothetical protein